MNIKQQSRSLNPKDLPPYRVEWRSDLTCGWILMSGCQSHEEALKEMKSRRKEYGGQTRVVCQHVISAEGLGAHAF